MPDSPLFDSKAAPTLDPSSRSGRAFSKARKRLRGESVSPSPKKQPRISAPPPIEESGDPNEDETYVDESPVKTNAGAKDFVSLFDEERIPSPDFLGKRNSAAGSSAKEQLTLPVLKQPNSSQGGKAMKSVPGKLIRAISHRSSLPEDSDSLSNLSNGALAKTENGLTNRKRHNASGSDRSSPVSDPTHASTSVFLPPSPTQDGKTKSNRSTNNDFLKRRKKMGTLKADDVKESSLDDDIVDVIELDPISRCRARNRHNSDEDEEQSFLDAFVRRSNEELVDPSQTEPAHELEVLLPDELRSILYISQSQSSEMKERALAESLLKGDAQHPGLSDVWEAGEIERPTAAASDGEEDWEGEGTPWEVGEL